MFIEPATITDLPAILELQKLAYQSEAKLLNNFNIPPLTQTLTDIEKEFKQGIILKATDTHHQIIGSVRGYTDDNTLYIGKLIVRPNQQNQGLGTLLLMTIEKYYPQLRYELFTSTKSEKNLALYVKNGYKEFKREKIKDNLEFVFLEKQ
ncbi:GNAT family N-acetyltransferase [Entomomonas asaccharolytica]|uniref:GNAT family N-acetyltransferase n=1 Tax=Entomomonas asaccharolytica TaxID=2785331 RepID=A0A974RY96_9GAMM|nr:GNAT family N-acetyltransferase [Entomomonas asaccharolytica]QQP87035.1 GNAT family N-acetyltransferase [Entomomonas asaccharolytica]